jgi:8-oxo-dGTP diphosphatase
MLVIDKGEILLIKRNKKLKDFPGWYMLPGGKQEFSETPLQAAVREVFEETGLKVENPKLRVVATHYHGYKDRVYLVYIFEAGDFFGKLKRSKEGRPVWMKIEDALRNPKLYPDLKRHVRLVLDSEGDGVIFTYHRFNNKLEIVEVE